jgi:hypothetical protein
MALGKPVTTVGAAYTTAKGASSQNDQPALQMDMANEMLAITPEPKTNHIAIGTNRQTRRGTKAKTKTIGQTKVKIKITAFPKP